MMYWNKCSVGVRIYLGFILQLLLSSFFSIQPVSHKINDFTVLNARLDSTMNELFIPGVGMPGLQIVISKNEELVYQNSFGFADIQKREPVNDQSLFRIASISKPITAVAILKLVEDGKLALDQKVFGETGILSYNYGTPPYSPDIKKITVRHLLEHSSGWINEPNDPMFQNNEWDVETLISDIVNNRLLEYEPGTQQVYLNFGYCLLGKIIENVSKMNYEKYVNEFVMYPSGIYNLKIAGNTKADRFEEEVLYYGQEKSITPYTMNVSRMDSHGGWVSNAEDLIKFIHLIDGGDHVEDILTKVSLQQMYFGNSSWSHTGSLPGSLSNLVKLNKEFSYAVLVNTRQPSRDILNEIHKVVVEEIESISMNAVNVE